jgi:hypothetical protein
MSKVIGFDYGNAWLKIQSSDGAWFICPSYVAELQPNEWKDLLARNGGNIPEGYLQVGRGFYAVGHTAKSHKPYQLAGVDRYVPEVYGVAFAYAITEAYQSNLIPAYDLVTTFAPRIVSKSIAQQRAVMGKAIKANTRFGEVMLKADEHFTTDEPLGGFYNLVLTNTGERNKTLNLGGKKILVLDGGGNTMDAAGVDGFQVDYSSLTSIANAGANYVLAGMEAGLRSLYDFNNAPLERVRLEQAIRTGLWGVGKFAKPCHELAQEQRNILLHNMNDLIYNMGGIAGYDVVVLTGGASGLVYDDFLAMYADQIEVELAADINHLARANAWGAVKIQLALRLREGRKASKLVKGYATNGQ